MPSKDTKILEFKQYQNCDKASFIIYTDLGCLIEKTDRYKIIPENLSTKNVSQHIPSSYSMSTIFSFKSIVNKRMQR